MFSPLRPLPLGLLILLATACSTHPTDSAATTSVTTSLRASQGPLTAEQWQELVTADSTLAALEKTQTQPWQVAGTIVDASGTTLVWAEYAQDPAVAREQIAAVMRTCPPADASGTPPVCQYFKGQYTATGVTLTTDSGQPVTNLPIAQPAAWEWTLHANPQQDASTIVAALTGSETGPLDVPTLQAQMEGIQQQKRRFVVISPYGKQVGVDLQPIVEAAKRSGRFDAVESIEFVRRADVETLLPQLSVVDTLVWLGAGVQPKLSKTSTPGQPLGMNVSRGIVGDEVYYGAIAQLGDLPLGGPGLIVLAGQNTVLAGTSPPGKQTLAGAWHEPGGARVVVGLAIAADAQTVGNAYAQATLEQVKTATVALIDALGQGKDLDAAMQGSANLGAAAGSLTWQSPYGPDHRKTWTWTAPAASFWVQKPSTGKLAIKLSLTPKCKKSQPTCDGPAWQNAKSSVQVTNGSITVLCQNPLVNGPYISCAGESQPPGTKFTVNGVLQGSQKGSHFLFVATGDDAGPLAGATVLGDGVIAEESDVGGGTTSYKFNGYSAISAYADSAGNCCWSQPPLLIGSNSSDLSVLELQH